MQQEMKKLFRDSSYSEDNYFCPRKTNYDRGGDGCMGHLSKQEQMQTRTGH